MSLTPLKPEQTRALGRDLEAKVAELANAIDPSISYSAQGQASFSGCGPGACTVTATVTGRFQGKYVTNPQVTADMTVTMTFDGAAVGGCASTGTLPVNGTGTMSCVNVSPAWTAAYSRAQASDRAMAASGRQPPAHIYAAQVSVTARAMAEADVAAMQQELQRRIEELLRSLPPEPAGGAGGEPPVVTPPGNRPAGDEDPYERKPEYNESMRPEDRQKVADALKAAKFKDEDVDRALVQLAKSPYGARIAEVLVGGRLAGAEGLLELLSQVKQKEMIQAVTMALDHAVILLDRGIPVQKLVFEHKEPGLDLDVAVRGPDGGFTYGAQLKGVDKAKSLPKHLGKIADTQLVGDAVPHKVVVFDINESKAALTERLQSTVAGYAERMNATVHLRFTDGTITLPGDGRIFPEGAP